MQTYNKKSLVGTGDAGRDARTRATNLLMYWGLRQSSARGERGREGEEEEEEEEEAAAGKGGGGGGSLSARKPGRRNIPLHPVPAADMRQGEAGEAGSPLLVVGCHERTIEVTGEDQALLACHTCEEQ
eukprot:712197-Hanusia_phi.AAC.1